MLVKQQPAFVVSTAAYASNQSQKDMHRTMGGNAPVSIQMMKENINYGVVSQSSNLQASEIWKEPPEPDFPQFLIEKMDLDEMKQEIMQKADLLREKIQQRKEEEIKKIKEENHRK